MLTQFRNAIPLLFMAMITVAANAQEKVTFEVSFSEPQAHYVDVEMTYKSKRTIKDYMPSIIKMPVWAPGSYLIREFAKNVEDIQATGEKGNALKIEKTSKNTWAIYDKPGEKITVKYRVYSFESSVRTSFVDASHAFLSPTGIFMYADNNLKQAAEVIIKPYKTWTKVSTGLEAVQGKPFTYSAPDFDILFDSPIEIGNQDVFEFNAAGVRHEVAMYGGGNYDKDRLKRDMAKVVEEETAVFGVNPNKYYVFIVHNYNNGGGGLEHLNSTVLGASRNSYSSEAGYKNFLRLVAHEYFHLWNVKRLRPIALGPFDYDTENYTSNLWIAEGFTAYYDDLIVKRAGFTSAEEYLNTLSSSISTVENQPGNRVQPVSQSSFDAWIKQYRPNENSKNSTISYYDKGSMIALVMDLEIIHATKGKSSLDDVMKAMYDTCYVKLGRGYTDAEFKAMAEKIAGKSFGKIYADYINGTKQIDYNMYLGYAGLSLKDDAVGKNDPYLGVASTLKDGKLMVTGVARGSSAWISGLNVNDEIIGADGYRIEDVSKIIAAKKVGDKVTVLINRDGVLQNIEVVLIKDPNAKFKIMPLGETNAEQLLVRKKWLKL